MDLSELWQKIEKEKPGTEDEPFLLPPCRPIGKMKTNTVIIWATIMGLVYSYRLDNVKDTSLGQRFLARCSKRSKKCQKTNVIYFRKDVDMTKIENLLEISNWQIKSDSVERSGKTGNMRATKIHKFITKGSDQIQCDSAKS